MIARGLAWVARHGAAALPLGLVAGVALPGLSADVAAGLPWLVGLQLALAALRVDPRAALRGGRRAVVAVLALQLALPLVVAGAAAGLGLAGPLVAALALTAAAPMISGGPSITLLAGGDATAALRLLIVGVALTPLTAGVALALAPPAAAPADPAPAVLRLMAVIALACGLAIAARRFAAAAVARFRAAAEGLSVLTLAVLVVGLMGAVGPLLLRDPAALLALLAVAFAANFGMQGLAFALAGRRVPPQERIALTVAAGNRNVALFLAALPPETVAPMLAFIGCYQVPMYLTPLALRRLTGVAGEVQPRHR